MLASTSLCDLVWQGDFGKGIATGSGVWSDPGFNPCVAYPVPSTTAPTTGAGIPQPQFRLGMTFNGDFGSEFILAKLVLASATDLIPGQVYQLDERFTATLLSTTNANNILNYEVGVLNVWYPQAPAGTYYIALQRAGHCSVKVDSATATGSGETSATTAGSLKFPAAATAGQKSVSPTSAFVAASGVTFTGNTTSGSPYITNVVSAATLAGIEDLQVGQVITGTGMPSNAIIAAIDSFGGKWRITIGTNTAGSYSTLQNATSTATGTTFTVTSHVAANIYWPTLAKQN